MHPARVRRAPQVSAAAFTPRLHFAADPRPANPLQKWPPLCPASFPHAAPTPFLSSADVSKTNRARADNLKKQEQEGKGGGGAKVRPLFLCVVVRPPHQSRLPFSRPSTPFPSARPAGHCGAPRGPERGVRRVPPLLHVHAEQGAAAGARGLEACVPLAVGPASSFAPFTGTHSPPRPPPTPPRLPTPAPLADAKQAFAECFPTFEEAA